MATVVASSQRARIGDDGLLDNGAAHAAWPSTALHLVWLAIALASAHRLPR